MSRLQKILDGFGGRLVLWALALITTTAMAAGGFIWRQVDSKQANTEQAVTEMSERVTNISERLVATNGEKVSREEMDRKLDSLRQETREHRAETRESFTKMERRLDQIGDLLMARRGSSAQN